MSRSTTLDDGSFRTRLSKFFLFTVLILAATAAAACGGGDDDSSGEEQGATATPTQGESPASDPTATPTSETTDASYRDACEAFSSLQLMGGSAGDVKAPSDFTLSAASDSPSSEFAEAAASFGSTVLSDTAGVDVSASCFFEVSGDEGEVAWISFALPEGSGPFTSDALKDAAINAGAGSAGAFSLSFGGDMTILALDELPFGSGASTGGALYVLDQHGVLMAGDDPEVSDEPAPTPTPEQTPSTAPDPTPTPSTGVTDGGTAEAEYREACEAFSSLQMIGGSGGLESPSGFELSAASDSPDSEFAQAASSFAGKVLSEAVGADLEGDCFFHVSGDEGDVIWISYRLPKEAGTASEDDLRRLVTEAGAESAGAFSLPFAGGMTVVALDALPFGESGSLGGAIYIMGDHGVFMAGQDPEGLSGALDDTPDPTPTREPSGAPDDDGSSGAGDVAAAFESALEDALGVEIEVESSTEASLPGMESIVIRFKAGEGDLPSGAGGDLEDMVSDLDGTVNASFSGPEGDIINFESVDIAGTVVSGNLTLSGDRIDALLRVE